MRKIKEILIHCSATPQTVTFDQIRKYHIEVRKFSDIGYHFLIDKDGVVHIGRDIETVGAHCKYHNSKSIGICLVGGTDEKGKYHTFTAMQYQGLNNLLATIFEKYGYIVIYPHNYFANKLCPDFILKDHLKSEYQGLVRNNEKMDKEIKKHAV